MFITENPVCCEADSNWLGDTIWLIHSKGFALKGHSFWIQTSLVVFSLLCATSEDNAVESCVYILVSILFCGTQSFSVIDSVPLLSMAGLLWEGGRTVAPLKALSRWLCCLASCSSVSSSRTLCSLSACRAFCQRLLWAWANERKSRQAWVSDCERIVKNTFNRVVSVCETDNHKANSLKQIYCLVALRWSWRWRWCGRAWLAPSPAESFRSSVLPAELPPAQTRTWKKT